MSKDNTVSTFELFPESSGALFAPCRKWHFTLWRTWDSNLPIVNWLILNPSTADESILDNTLTRCQNFTQAWGYGGMVITNLFAYRATEPMDMKQFEAPIGIENDRHIVESATASAMVICGWGTHGKFLERDEHVKSLLRDNGIKPYCLKINADKSPSHPLYLSSKLRPLPLL